MTDQRKQSQRRATGQGVTRKHSATSTEAVTRWKRDLRCVELRTSGATFQQIADELGYTDRGHAYRRFLTVMREYPREDVETWRNTISDRYDAMLAALWPDCRQGKWLAIDRAIRICEAQARLHGANRPEKIEVTPAASELDAALRELEAELRLRAQGRPPPRE